MPVSTALGDQAGRQDSVAAPAASAAAKTASETTHLGVGSALLCLLVLPWVTRQEDRCLPRMPGGKGTHIWVAPAATYVEEIHR